MIVSLAGLALASIAVSANPALRPRAAAEGEQDRALVLRAATFEPVPAAFGDGRFRLSARLQPAPVPAATGRAGTLELDAVLSSKAAGATCPFPGTIFSDGYESP